MAHWILVDYENVRPSDFHPDRQPDTHVIVFLGPNQHKIPADLVMALQAFGSRGTIRSVRRGRQERGRLPHRLLSRRAHAAASSGPVPHRLRGHGVRPARPPHTNRPQHLRSSSQGAPRHLDPYQGSREAEGSCRASCRADRRGRSQGPRRGRRNATAEGEDPTELDRREVQRSGWPAGARPPRRRSALEAADRRQWRQGLLHALRPWTLRHARDQLSGFYVAG